MQRCSRSAVDEWEEIFIEANSKIDNIKKKILEIRTHIGQSDQFMFNRAFDFAIEEFIEAIGFFWFLKVWFEIIYYQVFLFTKYNPIPIANLELKPY